MNIGSKIRQLRNDTNMTQQQLADKLKISRSTLACYETEKRQVPNALVIDIAKFFDVSTDYLFGLEE